MPKIIALENECFFPPWSEKSYAPEIERGGVLGYLPDSEILAGIISYRFIVDEAEVIRIAVSEKFRRRGIAVALIRALEFELAHGKTKCNRILLEVRESNSSAQKLYERTGFSKLAERTNYYGDGETALIFTKNCSI